VYLLDKDSQARFIVIDADDDEQYTQVVRMAVSLRCHGLPSYLERDMPPRIWSRSNDRIRNEWRHETWQDAEDIHLSRSSLN
jgi:hypothetical protein